MSNVIDLRKQEDSDFKAKFVAADSASSAVPRIDGPAPKIEEVSKSRSFSEEPRADDFSTTTQPVDDDVSTDLDFHERITWQGPRYMKRATTSVHLYLSLSLFGIGLLLLIFRQDYMAAVLFFALAGWLWYRQSQDVEVAEFEVNSDGVRVDEKFYPMSEIENFWIHYDPEHNHRELSINLFKKFTPYIRIPIYEEDPVQIRSILIESVPEEQHEETFIDTLERLLGI